MDVSQIYAANQPRPDAQVSEKRTDAAEQRAEKGEKLDTSIAEQTRDELNAAIIQSAAQVSLTSGNEPLHLLYSAAIDKLNEVLAPELGEDAIQKAAERPEEFTPEATAERIVQFATSFYAAYSEQHPEMTEEERVNSFMDLISGAVDQGFGEAKDVLEGLKVYDGAVKEGRKTYDLIQQGLESFRDTLLGKDEEESEEVTEESAEEEKAEKSEEDDS